MGAGQTVVVGEEVEVGKEALAVLLSGVELKIDAPQT